MLGTHSNQILTCNLPTIVWKAVVNVWMWSFQEAPLQRAAHTAWLSMKKITSRSANAAANVYIRPAAARSSKGIICVLRAWRPARI